MLKMKAAFALLAMTALSACNMVVSDKPWFDASSGPQLKDGLWANLESPACKVDGTKPLAEWPQCAAPLLVRGNTYYGPPTGKDPAVAAARFDTSKWQPLAHSLVEGDPQIDQLFVDLSKASSADGIDRSKAKSFYLYLAVKPIATDSAGRITETQRWPILCGPIPAKPNKSKNGTTEFVTDKPFDGLIVAEGACTARDPAALRGAAKQSEGVAQSAGFAIITSRWVNDGPQ